MRNSLYFKQFETCHFSTVTNALSQLDHAGVAPFAVSILGRDIVKKMIDRIDLLTFFIAHLQHISQHLTTCCKT